MVGKKIPQLAEVFFVFNKNPKTGFLIKRCLQQTGVLLLF